MSFILVARISYTIAYSLHKLKALEVYVHQAAHICMTRLYSAYMYTYRCTSWNSWIEGIQYPFRIAELVPVPLCLIWKKERIFVLLTNWNLNYSRENRLSMLWWYSKIKAEWMAVHHHRMYISLSLYSYLQKLDDDKEDDRWTWVSCSVALLNCRIYPVRLENYNKMKFFISYVHICVHFRV